MRLSKDMAFFVVLLIAGGAGVYYVHGAERMIDSGLDGLILIAQIMPLILAALMVGGYFQAIVPRQKVAALLGDASGVKGLLIATLAGVFTPGGPFASFPLVVALFQAGAGYGASVAYLTAWTGLSLQRAIIWEWPLLGAELAVTRYIVSIPLPIIAGLIARYLAARFLPPPREGEG